MALNCIFGCLSNEKVEDGKPPKKETPNISYVQLYKFATPLEKLLMSFAVSCSIIGGTSYALFASIFGTGVDGIITYASDITNTTNETTLAEAETRLTKSLNEFAISTGFLGVVIVISTYLSTFLLNYTALKQVNKIRKMYLFSILHRDMAWHDLNRVDDFSSDLQKLQEGIGEKIGTFLCRLTIMVVCIIQATIKGWKLVAICSIPISLSFVLMVYFRWEASKLAKSERRVFGNASVVAEEALSGIKTVVAFDGREEEKKRYTTLIASAMKMNIKKSYYDALINAITTFSIYGSSGVALWYGIRLVVDGRVSNDGYTAASAITILKAITNATLQLSTFAPLLETFGTAQGAAAKIFHAISNRKKLDESSRNEMEGLKGKVTFDNIHFSYPSKRETKVLNGIRWSINPGETIALVGSSSCGKSTCLQLLQRFYAPDSGNIYVDDENLSNLNWTWFRKQIGVVGQEPVLFRATIAENIRFGFLEANQSDIEEAAVKANAHAFITSLPKGYETVVQERGAQLSVGQRQRIALARALVRKPTILLLDEVASSIYDSPAAKECTTIIVAHKLSTVRQVDRIIVIQEGKVVEDGSHNKLISLKGLYYQMLSSSDSTSLKNTEEEEDTREKNDETVGPKDNLVEDPDEIMTNGLSVVRAVLKESSSENLVIIFACTTSILSGLSFPLYGLVFGNALSGMSETDNKDLLAKINSKVFQFILGGLAFSLIGFAQAYLWGIAGEKLAMKLRVSMFNSMLHQEVRWFDRSENNAGSLCARLSNEVASVQKGVGQKLAHLLPTASLILSLLLVGLYLQYKLLLVALLGILVLIASVYYEATATEAQGATHYRSLEESTKLVMEAISSIKTVAYLGLENMFLTQYMNKVAPHVNKAQRNAHVRGIIYGLAKSSILALYAVCFHYGAMLLKGQEATCDVILSLPELFMMASLAIAINLAHSSNFTSGLMAAKRIFKLIDSSPKLQCGPSTNFEGNILYRNVGFAYPTQPGIQILKNFNMLVVKNKTVALVGSDGCGKSTIIQLLECFYDVSGGEIFCGETNVTKANLSALRMRLGVVFQEPNLLSRTIGENIAYGVNRRTVKKEEIIEAAIKANAHEFIESLPLGYETQIGKKGTQLSEGQKQRIAIARALVRNPRVLLIDDATSTLDSEDEQVVQEALDNAKEGKTCIVTARRLKTVKKADVIMVINQGSIVEKGTHEELMKLKSLYWKLYKAQHQ